MRPLPRSECLSGLCEVFAAVTFTRKKMENPVSEERLKEMRRQVGTEKMTGTNGGMCWYCHWGWAKAVRDIYDEFIQKINEADGNGYSAMRYGRGHIVWEYENFDDEAIKGCLARKVADCGDMTQVEFDLVGQSLEKLLAVPFRVRCCEPAGYDGERPENYPPPADVEMHR
jgi:hypothetical protein